jgi:hypothetical protein
MVPFALSQFRGSTQSTHCSFLEIKPDATLWKNKNKTSENMQERHCGGYEKERLTERIMNRGKVDAEQQTTSGAPKEWKVCAKKQQQTNVALAVQQHDGTE